MNSLVEYPTTDQNFTILGPETFEAVKSALDSQGGRIIISLRGPESFGSSDTDAEIWLFNNPKLRHPTHITAEAREKDWKKSKSRSYLLRQIRTPKSGSYDEFFLKSLERITFGDTYEFRIGLLHVSACTYRTETEGEIILYVPEDASLEEALRFAIITRVGKINSYARSQRKPYMISDQDIESMVTYAIGDLADAKVMIHNTEVGMTMDF